MPFEGIRVEVSMQIGVSTLPDRVQDPATADPGAQTSGPGFDRLVAAAQAEADRRKAIADKSGASADQFNEQSWFAIMKAHGAEIGLGNATNKITKDSHGQLTVNDPVLRAKVINYRNDPLVRSIMAVKRAGDGKALLNSELGRQPSDAEVRAADAIGAKAAAKLILTRQSTPNASAALTAPDAATANRATFYRPDGSPQTVNEVLVKLMKPADATNPLTDRLATSRTPVGSAPASAPSGPAAALMPLQGMTPDMVANMRARDALSPSNAPVAPAPQPRASKPTPPDLALVSGTIGNLSMPGMSKGPAAPTGGKLSGWRAQMAGEVTHQIEHPESAVTNAPSKVTIAAPDPSHHAPIDQYAAATAVPAPIPAPTTMLGPQLAPPTASQLPVPVATPLPTLVAATPMAPTSALPLLPIDEATGPIVLSPQAAPASDAAPVAAVPDMQIAPVVVRPSRYGPGASLSAPAPTTRELGYAAASPLLQTQAISDASSAGIRPSRYYASTVRQMAALAPQTPAPLIPQSSAPSQPIAAQPVLGPDGVPILPPVPRPAGLPPITATEALQPVAVDPSGRIVPATQTALLDGTKPLDLAPSVPMGVVAPAAAPQPAQPLHRPPRPRLTPPSRF